MPDPTKAKVSPDAIALDELGEQAAHVANELRGAGDLEAAGVARALAAIFRRIHTRAPRSS